MLTNKKAFTLVELVIALAFLSTLLMAATYGFIQINRSYARGISVKTIQESTRNLVEDISREIRTSSSFAYSEAGEGYRLCLDGVRYIWNQYESGSGASYLASQEKFSDKDEVINIVRSRDTASCDDVVSSISGEKVFDDRVVVQYMKIEAVSADTYKIKVVSSTVDAVATDLEIFGSGAKCKPQISYQYCNVANYETVVSKR